MKQTTALPNCVDLYRLLNRLPDRTAFEHHRRLMIVTAFVGRKDRRYWPLTRLN